MAFSLKPGWLFLVPVLALAQEATSSLRDPTRPPAAFSSSAAETDLSSADAQAGGRLRFVLMPRRGGKPSALIDGQVVPLGGRVGDARLIRLTESEAVLEGAAGREILYLTPGVSKKPVQTKTARERQKERP